MPRGGFVWYLLEHSAPLAEGDCRVAGLPFTDSVSGFIGGALVDGFRVLKAGLPSPEFGSNHGVVGEWSGRRMVLGVSSDVSAWDLRKALARLSRNCLVASFGSDALFGLASEV